MAKIKQPIPKLPAFPVVTSVLSFFGHSDHVQDLLQHLSRDTRIYAKSPHMALLLNDLKPHRWTAEFSTLPEILKEQDVQLSPRHCSYRYIMKRQIEVIVHSWNNPANTNLSKVVQNIATDYRAYIKEVDPNLTTWALLVKRQDCQLDEHFIE